MKETIRYLRVNTWLIQRTRIAVSTSRSTFPNATDREKARKLGARPGGNIEIHGLDSKYAWVGSLQRQVDWTDGCIAVTNPEIEEIWPMVPVGTPVEIRP
jgi:murein L,D-transpeptidase YafK